MDADAATGGESAVIQYNLGLINLEMGNVTAAADNARKAYSMGYPLPGLKKKLQQAGHWTEVTKQVPPAQSDLQSDAPPQGQGPAQAQAQPHP